jgi:hypothetical protein
MMSITKFAHDQVLCNGESVTQVWFAPFMGAWRRSFYPVTQLGSVASMRSNAFKTTPSFFYNILCTCCVPCLLLKIISTSQSFVLVIFPRQSSHRYISGLSESDTFQPLTSLVRVCSCACMCMAFQYSRTHPDFAAVSPGRAGYIWCTHTYIYICMYTYMCIRIRTYTYTASCI